MQRLIVLVALAAGLLAPAAGAQPIQFAGEERPLPEALLSLRAQVGVDVVFAQQLVENRTTACRYRGERAKAALRCLLDETDLRARKVSEEQYVVVPRESSEAAPEQPGRLAGRVLDERTGAPLLGAHVYLPGLETGTTTNKDGAFAVSALPSGTYRVRVSYLGYATRDTTLQAGDQTALVTLQSSMFRADSVVVEGQRDKRAGRATAPGLIHLPVRQLSTLPSFLGGQDLFQAFQWLPGVRRSGALSGGLSIRGASPDQNLYLLDGAPIYHPWHAFSLVSTFQTNTFRDVELYRGAFPAEYGGRLASVMSAEMKDGSSRSEPSAVAALGLLSGRFRIESPLTERTSFMVSARRSYIDKLIGREHPVESGGRRDTLRTGYYFYDVSGKIAHQLSPRHRFSLSYYHGRDNLDLRLPFDVSLDFDSWLEPAPFFFEVSHNWENELYSFRHRYLPSSRLLVTTTAYYSNYHATERTLIQPTESAKIASDYGVRLDDVGLKVDVDYTWSETHQWRGGVQLAGRRFRSSLDGAFEHSPAAVDSLGHDGHLRALEGAAYVQDTWRPARQWRVQPGLRASFFSSGRFVRLEPRLQVQHALVPQRLTLRGAVSRQTQYIHQLRDRHSFLYDLVSSRWIPADDDVPPSTSTQAALGLEWRPRPWLTLTADGYWRRSRDMLLPRDVYREKDELEGPGIDVGALLRQYTRARGRTYGLELSARIERGTWQARLNYSGGRSMSRALALGESSFRPDRFDVPRSFRGVVNGRWGPWSATLSTELRSGFPHTVPVARYALGDPLEGDPPTRYLSRPRVNNGRLPPYLRVDLGGAYRFRWLGARWRAGLQLFNTTNRRNTVGRDYDPTARAAVTSSDRNGLPILPLLELEMRL
jgi:hypothetical protein